MSAFGYTKISYWLSMGHVEHPPKNVRSELMEVLAYIKQYSRGILVLREASKKPILNT